MFTSCLYKPRLFSLGKCFLRHPTHTPTTTPLAKKSWFKEINPRLLNKLRDTNSFIIPLALKYWEELYFYLTLHFSPRKIKVQLKH